MKSYVKFIGVIDKADKAHFVEFSSGLNVITGKSSTGKSAIIEIFDYCFGSSEFTVPSGVITDSAAIYFLIMSIQETYIVIGRSPEKTAIFLKEETSLPDIKTINLSYFDKKFYSSDFNIELGHYFGLDIKDVDEDEDLFKLRGKKKGRPSIRNAIPFLLQHQNLIANKHSLFYRFDQKEKRDQTIEQFKIFAGFVSQEYFLLKQKLAEQEKELKKLKAQKESIEEQRKCNSGIVKELLEEFEAITGYKLFHDEEHLILLNPGSYLEKLSTFEIIADYESNKATNELKSFTEECNKLYAKKRRIATKLNDISISVEYVNKYKEGLSNIVDEEEADIHLSKCPFCAASHEKLLDEANKLEKAIEWLNGELQKSPYFLDSFESDKMEEERALKEVDEEIHKVKSKIESLKKITAQLEKNKNLESQAQKIQFKLENLLESFLKDSDNSLEQSIKISNEQISELKEKLQKDFDVSAKLKKAENFINKAMKDIGDSFEFEDSYKPINLKFSLESFDLWHEKGKDKIYLRSMGSGANWLYSHITLFLAIQKYFASNKRSRLPSVLFLDQPSQVYFPTAINDNDSEFDPQKIKEKEGKIEKLNNLEKKKKIDDDLNAVTNLYNQLVKHVKSTKENTGIEPQIIVTDHADHLKLENDVEWETLVNGRRWRTRGFIFPQPG